MCMYIHHYACIYIYIQLCIYTIMYYINIYIYIYICTNIYIYTQPNLMREDDCTDMFVDTFLFMAEQLRNVSAMDAVCALHHISTSGLLAVGYIVMYIYTHVYIYNVYVLYMTIHGYIYVYIYMYISIYTHNYVYIQLSIGCGMCWRTSNGQGKRKQQMDGPGRIRARNHLLARLLQNAPGA